MQPQHSRLASSLEAYRPSAAVLRRVHGLRSHEGRIAAIEPRSGAYFIADNTMDALQLARAEHPTSIFYIVRIGHKAAHRQSSPNRRIGR